MRVDIWSDVICPWCFLGKRRFDAARSRLPWADELEVRWRAFLLDPRAGRDAGDLRGALERKYGPGAFEAMTGRLVPLGAADGITYRFDLAQRVGTVDAHRLLAWSWAEHGSAAQDALQERLFRAYFEEGANVAVPSTLTSLAAQVGLDPGVAADVLASDAYRDEVADDLGTAVERQLTGVPAFVIEDRFLLPGAQEVETVVAVLERARNRLAEEAAEA